MSYSAVAAGDHLDGTIGSTYDVPITIAAWVKLTAAQWADTGVQFALAFGDDSADENSTLSLRRAGADSYGISIVSSGGTQQSSGGSFPDTTYDSKWAVWVGKFTNDTSRQGYFGDSTEKTGHDVNSRPVANLDYVRVGERVHSTTGLDGLIAEVAVWNKALSDAEIDQLESASETGPAPNTIATANCVGYWPLAVDQANHTNQGNGGTWTLAVQSAMPYSADHPTITSSGISIPIAMYHYRHH